MSDGRGRLLWLLVGTGLVLAAVVGLVTGAFADFGRGTDSAADGVLLLVALAGVAVAVWHVRRSDSSTGGATTDETTAGGSGAGSESDAGTESGTAGAADPVVTATPEYAATDDVLSGRGLSWLLDEAGVVARDDRTVEAGVEWLRPTLRVALLDVLVHGQRDRTAAETAVDDGSWTDDPVAASVLSDAVSGPPLSFRQRLYAWLFPERVLRERVRVAVAEIARVADESLSTVPGEHAPRTIPVVTPSVDEAASQTTKTAESGTAAIARDEEGSE